MRIVLIADTISVAQRQLVRQAITNAGAIWWNFVRHLWLIQDPLNRNPVWWRDWITDVAPGPAYVVLEATAAWAAQAPPDVFPWLEQNWG